MATKLLQKALKSVGGLEKYKEIRRQFSEDLAFIDDNRDKLIEEYNETWIAVYKSQIIAYGKDYKNVLSRVEKQNLPAGQVPIRYLSTHKVFTLYHRQ